MDKTFFTGIELEQKFSCDMSRFRFIKAVKCEFDPASNFVAVSGKVEDWNKDVGEIVTFEISRNFDICSRITNRPHDAQGCWFNSRYLISCDFKWLASGISTSMTWMNKIMSLSDESIHDFTISGVRSLSKFYNPAGSAIRNFLIADISLSNKSFGEADSAETAALR